MKGGGRRKDSGLGFTPEFEYGDSEGNTTPTSHPITKKKKPKRRSTGVVNLLLEDESEQKSEESADEGGPGSATPESPGRKGVKNGGEIDYKKLWEESQRENNRLKSEITSIRSDLDSVRHQLDAAVQASTKNSVSDSEKREKKMLEKKLAEMEEELKQLSKLSHENDRLKSENRALTRVVAKLTAAASSNKVAQAQAQQNRN